MIYLASVIVLVIGVLAVLAVVYQFILRPKLRINPRFKAFYDWLEPIERELWDKSKTMLVARLYQLAGLLITAQALMQESGIDWLALIPVPEPYSKYVGPILWVTGLLFAKLRKLTTEPLEVKRSQNVDPPADGG